MKVTVCAACKVSVIHKGHFGASHQCPMEGTPAGVPCPVNADHGSLVFHAAKYNTYRKCKVPGCDGKLQAQRGSSAAQTIASGAGYHQSHEGTQGAELIAEAEIVEDTHTNADITRPEVTLVNATPETSSDAGIALWNLINATASEKIKAAALEAVNAAMAATAATRAQPITFNVDGLKLATVEGGHKMAAELVAAVAAGFRNIMIVGPAGSGKTTLAKTLADVLKRDFAAISCSEGMSESKLEGREIPNLTNGALNWIPTQITDAYQKASVILFDEVDSSNPNTLTALNSATANGHWSVCGRVINRHPDCVIIFAANTYGTGPDRMYVGRNQLDAATLDRFMGVTVEVDYDRDLEAALIANCKQSTQILARCWAIREKIAALKLRRIWGTRAVIAVARWVAAGKTIDDALARCATGWSADERSKAGIPA